MDWGTHLYTSSLVVFSSKAKSNLKCWFSRYLVRSTLVLGSWMMMWSFLGTQVTSISFRFFSFALIGRLRTHTVI